MNIKSNSLKTVKSIDETVDLVVAPRGKELKRINKVDLKDTLGVTTNEEAITANTADIATLNSGNYTIATLSPANIVAMDATPVTVLAAQGAGTVIEFISAVLVYDYDTATYAFGGDTTIKYDGGPAVSVVLDATDGFGAGADSVFTMAALNNAGGFTMPENAGLVITAAAGFTNPGTAAGVGRLHITYKVHITGL